VNGVPVIEHRIVQGDADRVVWAYRSTADVKVRFDRFGVDREGKLRINDLAVSPPWRIEYRYADSDDEWHVTERSAAC
jgi:hypothetical protein